MSSNKTKAQLLDELQTLKDENAILYADNSSLVDKIEQLEELNVKLKLVAVITTIGFMAVMFI